VAKGVRRDRANGFFSKDFFNAGGYNIAACGCSYGFNFFSGTFIVAGEQGQGGERAIGNSIKTAASI
jgi:hypothetical protein